MTRLSHSVRQTELIAAKLAAKFSGGQCIALNGELGAGKTQFVRGLVAGLGGNPRLVSSPTFVLLNVYPTPRFPVYHLDAYRARGSDDFEAIGFSELLDQGAVVVVEWAGRVIDLLPRKRINIEMEVVTEKSRRISIHASSIVQADPA